MGSHLSECTTFLGKAHVLGQLPRLGFLPQPDLDLMQQRTGIFDTIQRTRHVGLRRKKLASPRIVATRTCSARRYSIPSGSARKTTTTVVRSSLLPSLISEATHTRHLTTQVLTKGTRQTVVHVMSSPGCQGLLPLTSPSYSVPARVPAIPIRLPKAETDGGTIM